MLGETPTHLTNDTLGSSTSSFIMEPDDLTVVNFSSPDHAMLSVPASSIKKDSVYDKLGELAGTIESSIRSISPEAGATVEAAIQAMKREANRSSCPEVQYSMLLFNKYSEEATAASTAAANAEAPFIEIPTFLYEGTAEQLTSHEATSKNIFWMRAISAGASFICCCVMGSVIYINYAGLHPSMVLLRDCPYEITSGLFFYDSYKLIIAVSSFVFIHSILFVGYYLLPNDMRGMKYIPGIDQLLEKCMDRQQTIGYMTMGAFFCKDYSKLIELIVDACLVFLVFIASILGAYEVTQSREFSMRYRDPDNHDALPVDSKQWYTIDTFFLSFGTTEPTCVRQEDNPNSKIRSALFMCYVLLLTMSFTLQISYRSYDKETKVRNGTAGRQPVAASDPDATGQSSSFPSSSATVGGIGMSMGMGLNSGNSGMTSPQPQRYSDTNMAVGAHTSNPMMGQYTNINSDSGQNNGGESNTVGV